MSHGGSPGVWLQEEISTRGCTNEQGEVNASYRWTGWVWESTGGRSKTSAKTNNHSTWIYKMHHLNVIKKNWSSQRLTGWTWKHSDIDRSCPKTSPCTDVYLHKPFAPLNDVCQHAICWGWTLERHPHPARVACMSRTEEWILEASKSPPTLTDARHQWTFSSSIGCNQWLSLAKLALKVAPTGRNCSPMTCTSKCVWAILNKGCYCLEVTC
jgi:hypothetical protein